jgi:regulator of sirC expression with transglutaminase-like and TPR domain
MPIPNRAFASILLAALLIAAALPEAHAARKAKPATPPIRDYDACMERVHEKPDAALEAALAWERAGGGISARHCAAMALGAMGNLTDAADQLESLAWDLPPETPNGTRAEVLAQAGQFWLDANQPAKANAVLTAAVDLAPEDPERRIDRAMAYAATGRLQDAIIDLSASILLNPEPVEALVLRASAYRKTGRLAEAEDDLVRALALAPDDPTALLERGLLRRQEGDEKAAREAWITVLKLHPDGPAAAAARKHLDEKPAKDSGKAR